MFGLSAFAEMFRQTSPSSSFGTHTTGHGGFKHRLTRFFWVSAKPASPLLPKYFAEHGHNHTICKSELHSRAYNANSAFTAYMQSFSAILSSRPYCSHSRRCGIGDQASAWEMSLSSACESLCCIFKIVPFPLLMFGFNIRLKSCRREDETLSKRETISVARTSAEVLLYMGKRCCSPTKRPTFDIHAFESKTKTHGFQITRKSLFFPNLKCEEYVFSFSLPAFYRDTWRK